MAQHSGPGEPRRPRARPRRAGAGNKRTATAAGAGTGTGMAGGSVLGQLYWADSDSIWAANLDGTNVQNLLPAYEATMGVAVDSSHVYWINTNTRVVRRANPDGSNPQDLVPGQLALATGGVAVDTSHIYWTSYAEGLTAGTIRQANLDGSNPQAIVTGQATPFGIAVDASHIYWTNAGDGTIWRANLDSTNAQSIVQGEGQNSLFAVAVDANYVYWSNLGDETGAIRRANLVDGTNPQVFIPNTGGPQLLAFTPPPPPALGFTPSSYDFGQVRTREAASQSFTLANSGGQATGQLTVTMAGSAAFTNVSDTCTGTSLAPDKSCTVTVRFGPTSLGTVTATLTAASQTPAASATAALTGTGVRRLYWVNNGQTAADGSVNLANPDGSNAHTLTSSGDLPFPWGVAVDANLLYVAVHGDLANDPEFERFILSAENDDLDNYSKPFVFGSIPKTT